jgi:prephenate dehydratase
MVEQGNMDVAILPVWCFGETYRDNFINPFKSNLYEFGEIYLPDLHRLLALPGVSQEDLKMVISDRYPLLHCEHRFQNLQFENKNLKTWLNI